MRVFGLAYFVNVIFLNGFNYSFFIARASTKEANFWI